MARFDLYAEPDGAGFLLDVQTNLLHGFTTRVVIPVLPAESIRHRSDAERADMREERCDDRRDLPAVR